MQGMSVKAYIYQPSAKTYAEPASQDIHLGVKCPPTSRKLFRIKNPHRQDSRNTRLACSLRTAVALIPKLNRKTKEQIHEHASISKCAIFSR